MLSPNFRQLDNAPRAAEHVSEARRAYRRFGKGRHVAGLNFGEVFSYALARTSGEPLLFRAMIWPKPISVA